MFIKKRKYEMTLAIDWLKMRMPALRQDHLCQRIMASPMRGLKSIILMWPYRMPSQSSKAMKIALHTYTYMINACPFQSQIDDITKLALSGEA